MKLKQVQLKTPKEYEPSSEVEILFFYSNDFYQKSGRYMLNFIQLCIYCDFKCKGWFIYKNYLINKDI